jgi:hypothetical protein
MNCWRSFQRNALEQEKMWLAAALRGFGKCRTTSINGLVNFKVATIPGIANYTDTSTTK